MTGDAARPRATPWIIPALLALCTAALYLPWLQSAPYYPLRDEMYFSLTAHSVAAAGRDPSGLWLPVYFPIGPVGHPLMWFQPLLLYAMVPLLWLLPFSEGTIRLPMVAIGVLDVVLMYWVVKGLCRREVVAITAAALLALSPAHFMFSRTGLDYLAPVPFILGWLLCLIDYQRDGRPRRLIAAGLCLGVGLYSLIAAYILMPIYGLLTIIVLAIRREPIACYGLLLASAVVPAVFGLAFVVTHPELIRDVVMRYEPGQTGDAGGLGMVQTFIASRRWSEPVNVYLSFWSPQLLFIDGRGTVTGVAGMFLLPVAGLLLVGIARSLIHFRTVSVLLLGGLLTAPVPASLVNEPDAIRRALVLLPWVILLAAYGLDYLWAAPWVRVRRVAGFACWGLTIGLCVAYREYLLHVQPYIRAATIPLALVGLAAAFRGRAPGREPFGRTATVTVATLVIMQLAYYAAGGVVLVTTFALMAATGLAVLLRGPGTLARMTHGSLVAMALLAVICSEFVFFYLDFGFIQRAGMLPASAQVFAVRLACSGVLVIAVSSVVRITARAGSEWDRAAFVALAATILLTIQFLYLHIDYFQNVWLRYLHVAVVVMAVTVLALRLRLIAVSPLRFGQFMAAGVIGLAVMQFGYFYADYFTGYQVRRSSMHEGNVSVAYEALLARADAAVPAVYLGQRMETPFIRELYWKFYLVKHGREELLSRTINVASSEIPDADHLRALPAGALIVVSVSPAADAGVDQLVSEGIVRREAPVRAADGVAVYRILIRTVAGF